MIKKLHLLLIGLILACLATPMQAYGNSTNPSISPKACCQRMSQVTDNHCCSKKASEAKNNKSKKQNCATSCHCPSMYGQPFFVDAPTCFNISPVFVAHKSSQFYAPKSQCSEGYCFIWTPPNIA